MRSLQEIKQVFSATTRNARRKMHRCEMIAKKAKRKTEYVKSKHILPEEFSKGHKAWSIKGEYK